MAYKLTSLELLENCPMGDAEGANPNNDLRGFWIDVGVWVMEPFTVIRQRKQVFKAIHAELVSGGLVVGGTQQRSAVG